MDLRIDDQVALVTGASRGIGLETARTLASSGARGIVITSRRRETIDEACRVLIDSGIPSDAVLGLAERVDDDEAASRAVGAAIDRFGAVDVLVNNAGTNPAAGPLMDVDLGALDKTWAVNQRSPLVWAREVYHQWMADHGGVIVNVASVGALRPAPVIGAYNISKAAVVHLTKQLAFELAPTVRVNAVAPAVVKTKLSQALWAGDEEAAAATHPLGRLGEPEDVAAAILYLTTATWLTGTILPVDGGVVNATGTLA